MSKQRRIQNKVFAFGTVREVVVIGVMWHPKTGTTVLAIDKKETEKEAYVMMGHPPTTAQKGDEGIVTFTEGGETGGHWLYSAKTSILGV